jgi:hypothetical protein
MASLLQFHSYNIITNDQQERLRAIRQPLYNFARNHPTLFNTWALNERINDISTVDGSTSQLAMHLRAPLLSLRSQRCFYLAVSLVDRLVMVILT